MKFPPLFTQPLGLSENRELLAAYAAGDERAFAELVRRYGPLVLGCCRRVLNHAADAEDAFQATFLILARRVDRIARPECLAGWLHAVATRTAGELRRRRRPVHPIADRPADREPQRDSELIAVLDEEIARLPETYRLAVVLCELEGRNRRAVARELAIAEGTLSSRLAAARKRLADRLRRRGFAATGLAAALAGSAGARVPDALASAAIAGTPSAVATQLASGVMTVMILAKLKSTAAVGLAFAALAGGLLVLPGLGTSVPVAAEEKPAKPDEAAVKKLIQQLGAPAFADRDAAQKKLKAMGPAILALVDAARTDKDAEIAERCQSLAAGFRKELRDTFVKTFQADAKGDIDYPLWRHFKAIAGSDAASRKLFAEMIADAARFTVLDDGDTDPKQAAAHYKAVVEALCERGWKNWQPDGKDPPPAPSIPEIAIALFLGSIESTGKVEPDNGGRRAPAERFALLGAEFYTRGLKGEAAVPLKKLYGAWLVRRESDDVLRHGLERSLGWMISEALPVARKTIARDKAPLPLKIVALTALGRFGTDKDDGATVAKFFDDRTVVHTVEINGAKHVTEVRDVAVAVALHLKKAKPLDYGFRTYTGLAFDWAATPYKGSFSAFPTGFPSNDARNAAHDKAARILSK